MPRKPSIPTEQLSDETKHLYDVLNSEGDLAALLIATSFLDACLKSVLENKLLESRTTVQMLDHSGVLGTFNARMDLCYALGLIPKMWYQNLKTLAEMRNVMAHHHLNLSFNSPTIAEKCMKLTASFKDWEQSRGRTRFTLCVVILANHLLLLALQIKREPRVTRPKEPSHVYVKADGSK